MSALHGGGQCDGSRVQLSVPPEPHRAVAASLLSAQTDTGGHEG